MRVLIYVRVSTKLQEKKFSLEGQKTELMRYAESMDWEIVGTYQDVETGGQLEKVGLNALLDDVEDGKVDVVLVFDQDRLSRLDTLEWEFLKDVLRKNKVKIAEPGRIADLSNDDDEFFSDLKNLIAQREKKTVVRRMMNGKKQKMRRGESYGAGPFEYTYNKETKKFEALKEWAWVIPFIDDLYLNKQLGMLSIANKLNQVSKTPTGKLWNEHLVHTRLTSTAFHGIDEKTFSSGETIAVDGIYEPLRSKETFDKIQIERTKRGKQFNVYARKNDQLHLFRRTAFTCGECGRKIGLSQHGTKDKPAFYLRHGRRRRIADQTICDLSINTIRIEPGVRKAMKEIMIGEEFAKKYVKLGMHKNDIVELEKTLNSINKKINKDELKKNRLLDLYLEGSFDKNLLTTKQEEIQTSIDAFNIKKTELESELKLLQSESWGYDMVYNYLHILDDFEKMLTPFEQTQAFGVVFPEAIVHYDKLKLVSKINGAPVHISVPIQRDPHPTHWTKQHG